jgi:FKBP-type peptidyl-prolyl cis-trans isomerase
MKLKIAVLCIAGFATMSVFAGGSSPTPAPSDAPDKAKLSYAVGTRLGLQMVDVKSHVDTAFAIQAVQDVLDGKPTMIEESEIPDVLNKGRSADGGAPSADDKRQYSYAGGMRAALMFKRTGFDLDSKIVCQAIQDELDGKPKMDNAETLALFKQAAAYTATTKASSNKAEGEAFLAKNAKAPGINMLPDGLQYQIIQPGTGPLATTNDLIFVKFKGTFINGSEFEHHSHYLTRIYGGIQGWKDVLPQMKVGAEWRIFVPSNLAYGESGLASRGVSPNTTVIYDLQLLSIAPPDGHYQVNSAMGRGADIDASSPDPAVK